MNVYILPWLENIFQLVSFHARIGHLKSQTIVFWGFENIYVFWLTILLRFSALTRPTDSGLTLSGIVICQGSFLKMETEKKQRFENTVQLLTFVPFPILQLPRCIFAYVHICIYVYLQWQLILHICSNNLFCINCQCVNLNKIETHF